MSNDIVGTQIGIYNILYECNYKTKCGHKMYHVQCAECGWGEINPYTKTIPLEVHHKDGDYTNNDESNLELLCPNCHALTSNYKNANKGNGRKSRVKYNL